MNKISLASRMFSVMLIALLSICLALMVSSCSIFLASSRPDVFSDVKKGMTISEVRQFFGKPDSRRFDETVEQWEYVKDHVRGEKVCIIDFINGVVVGMDMFYRPVAQPRVDSGHSYPVPVPVPNNPYPHHNNHNEGNHCVKMISPRAYDMLYQMVKKESFSDDKLKALSNGLKGVEGYISPVQCAGILKLFSWDDDKLKALKMMKSRIYGNVGLNNIFDTFTSMFTKEDARKLFGL